MTRWREGDRVVALVSGGGYAEFCLAHETTALPLPEPLTMVEGAGIPETTFTVWHNVFQRGGLKPGEWLLVHGGTSGIGTTAIQIAKALGSLVATTAGSDAKCRAAARLGADLTIGSPIPTAPSIHFPMTERHPHPHISERLPVARPRFP